MQSSAKIIYLIFNPLLIRLSDKASLFYFTLIKDKKNLFSNILKPDFNLIRYFLLFELIYYFK